MMNRMTTLRLAKALRFMVTALIVCNMIALVMLPVFVIFTPGEFVQSLVRNLLHILNIKPLPAEQAELYMPGYFVFGLTVVSWQEVWTQAGWIINTLFLFVCGICTMVILRQAHEILDTVLEGDPFRMVNAVCMKRAAVSCWVISGLALGRLVIELFYYRDPAPLFTYNALFIPLFLVGGLLFLVMSALFAQASLLQEDQDLTI